jgi:hypothetical protein
MTSARLAVSIGRFRTPRFTGSKNYKIPSIAPLDLHKISLKHLCLFFYERVGFLNNPTPASLRCHGRPVDKMVGVVGWAYLRR